MSIVKTATIEGLIDAFNLSRAEEQLDALAMDGVFTINDNDGIFISGEGNVGIGEINNSPSVVPLVIADEKTPEPPPKKLQNTRSVRCL